MSLDKIICYIDLDNTSRNGVGLCGAIAENRGAAVEVVLTAAEMPFYSASVGGEYVFTPPSVSLAIYENRQAVVNERLNAAVETLESEITCGRITTHRLDEYQVDALIEHGRTLGADLIVMSSEASGLFDRLFHRSFAERLARQSICPVMVVAGDVAVASPLHTVLVAVDYSEASRRAAFVAREILDANATMHFQHVSTGPAIADASQSASEVDNQAGTIHGPGQQTELERLQDFVRNLYLNEVETRCHVSRGVPHEAINALAIDVDCDVVVLGSRPHADWSEKLFGTVTDRLIETCKKPILTVPKRFRNSRPAHAQEADREGVLTPGHEALSM